MNVKQLIIIIIIYYNPFKSIYIDRIYFHCNWGWNGSSDGFYLSDAFLSYKREVQMIANINVE